MNPLGVIVPVLTTNKITFWCYYLKTARWYGATFWSLPMKFETSEPWLYTKWRYILNVKWRRHHLLIWLMSWKCVKSVRIWSFLVRIFPHSNWIRTYTTKCISPYSVRMRENTNQKKYECGQFSRSMIIWIFSVLVENFNSAERVKKINIVRGFSSQAEYFKP